MEATGRQVNVVLVNWAGLATAFQISNINNYAYDEAALNAIDVGSLVGLCIAELSRTAAVKPANLHLVGHSLGAHLMGHAGRVFAAIANHLVGRITGLDPAGPRFVDGPILPAIPALNRQRLTAQSASFVDVIHTNGALQPGVVSLNPHCGDLHEIGNVDFYPSGGSEQPGTGLGGRTNSKISLNH